LEEKPRYKHHFHKSLGEIQMKFMRIVSDGSFTRLYDQNGTEIKIDVSSITWTHVAEDTSIGSICNIQIGMVATDINSTNNKFETRNPSTGKFAEIQLIRFADGTEWSTK
jgi:hypothetical protein